jgi:hypothetical protein
MNNEEIILDEKSGISIEEQREILTRINGIAEKNRSSLSHGQKQGSKNNINAKKTGVFFPLAVNIAAVIVLLGGASFLLFFNGRVDAQTRMGNAVYNLTERALIEEIRKDTAEKIAAKEMEISSIASRLQEVDIQLLLLQSSNENLTSDQLTAQERLLALQESYRDGLAVLQDERSLILEDSRLREVRLRSLLEERSRDFPAAQQRNGGETDLARDELERLTNEQERIAAIDAQFTGGLAVISGLVQDGQYAQAALAVENLRHFNNNNSLATARSFQTRREFYNLSINSMETIIFEMQKFQEVNSEGWDLFEKNTQLETTMAEMQRTIDAFSAGSSGQVRRLSELEESVSSLRTSVSTLETSASEKDRTINSLESERTQLNQTVTDLQTANSTQEQEIASLRNQIAIIRQALQE